MSLFQKMYHLIDYQIITIKKLLELI